MMPLHSAAYTTVWCLSVHPSVTHWYCVERDDQMMIRYGLHDWVAQICQFSAM